MKEKLIKHIEAYVSAKCSGNEILISYAVQALNIILEEVFNESSSKE